MECILMNFDDRIRIVHDISNMPVSLSVGETKATDLHPAIVDFLKKSMTKTRDPLVILESAKAMSPEIKQVMDILANISTAPYEETLARTIKLLGAENVGGPSPAREELRYRLRELASAFAQNPEAAKEEIVEKAKQIDAKVERKKAAPNESEEDDNPEVADAALARKRRAAARKEQDAQVLQALPNAPLPSLRDRMDTALGISIGADVQGLAKALTPAPAGEDEFDDSQSRPEPGKRKRPAKKAAKKKKALTSRAAKAKPAAKAAKPAKKPLGRVRA